MISTKKIISSLIIGTSLCLASTQMSCYKDSKEALFPSTACDTSNITWNKDIKTIVSNSCAGSGCHDASTASGSYALHNYSGTKTIADNGRLLAVIESGSMPKGSAKLDPCTINKIRRWVNQGAMEN